MAVKTSSFADKMRKIFMTRDAEAFEKAIGEMKDEDGMEKNVPDIHIHIPGAEKIGGDESTKDEESEVDPMAKVMSAIESVSKCVAAIGERVSKLEGGTKDSDEKKDETKDDAPTDEDDTDTETSDSDQKEEEGYKPTKTGDSASLRVEFQDAMARAEILAPGVKLPTFDASAAGKKTSDSICVLRRRALRGALDNGNAEIVRSIVGNADVSKMTCDAAKMALHAASEIVKHKNTHAPTRTNDSETPKHKDLNQIHAEFWSNRK